MLEKSQIKLKQVTKNDFRFLYGLLLERDPIANISHKKMPTYDEHVRFVTSKPYLRWYVVYYNGKKSGSAYLTKQNEIGIYIKKKFQKTKVAENVLKLIIEKNGPGRYFVNVNPKNKKTIEFFKKHGFKILQYTYQIVKS